MGTPKALVVDDDGPWLPRGVRALLDGGCAAVTVVLGAAASEAAHLLDGLATGPDTFVDVVVAEDWDRGMSASLRTGLQALADVDASSALVHLVDLPDVGPAVISRVIAAGGSLTRASYDGVPGHPVLIGRRHWAPIIASLAGDRGARDYLRAHSTVLVDCGDLASGRDVDSVG
ncbi:nucleotidyltransferase family protein [Nocardioides sp. AN3]